MRFMETMTVRGRPRPHPGVVRGPLRAGRPAHHVRGPLRAGRPAHLRPQGLTLMELLVALVLVSLLATLIVQGVAFFGVSYDAVKRSQRDATHTALRQRWFVSSVRGILPYGVEARAFKGDAAAFETMTMQPLNGEPGMPTFVRWEVIADGPWNVVAYAEDGLTEDEAISWRVLEADGADLSFQYADAANQWHDRWPLASDPTQWVPGMIRLVTPEATVWLASVDVAAAPTVTDGMLE